VVCETDTELLRAPEVQNLYKREIESLTKDLADFEKVRSFTLLEKPFSIEAGEMTPTLKIKRRVVVERYAPVVAEAA